MEPLADSTGRVHNYLRISVTERCNLQCAYCMPKGFAAKKHEEILTFPEIARAARIFAEFGVDKVRITGGEPTVREGVDKLIRMLRQVQGLKTLGLTTNGTRLRELAPLLKDAGLNSLNISLDTLRRDRFHRITHCDLFTDVMAGINAAVETGFDSLKLNTVVMAGVNDDELLDFIEFARSRKLSIRFIEFMPFGGILCGQAGFMPCWDMLRVIQSRYSLRPCEGSADPCSTAKEFETDGFAGTIGFITAMSRPFCTNCNRIRLMADGVVKPCLMYPAEVSIRDALRDNVDDETLMRIIRSVVMLKPQGHPPLRELAALHDRSMVEIGG